MNTFTKTFAVVFAVATATQGASTLRGAQDQDPCAGLSFAETFKDRGINPDTDILYNSSRVKWADVCTVIQAWNTNFPEKPFLAEADLNNNLLTLAALFGNAAEESANYVACAEYITPCPDPSKCSGGAATDYEDSKWGTCYAVPQVSGGDFILGGSLPANACNSNPTCTGTNGISYSGPDCWYGRGALQLTWNCNYAKAQALITPLNLGIDICSNPDDICQSGETFFAASLAYWMMTVEPYFLQDHRMDTAMNCVKNGCNSVYPGPWSGSGADVRRAEFERLVELLGATPNQ